MFWLFRYVLQRCYDWPTNYEGRISENEELENVENSPVYILRYFRATCIDTVRKPPKIGSRIADHKVETII
jgi:hypothetical protein